MAGPARLHWKSNFPLQPRLENVIKLKTKQISERSPPTKGARTSCPSPSTSPSCSTFVTPCLTPLEREEEAVVVIGKDAEEEEEEEEEEGTDGSGGTGVEAGDETDVGTTAGRGRGSSRTTSTAPPPGPSSWQSLTGRRGTGSSQHYNRRRQGRRRPQEPQRNSRRILRTALPPPPQGPQGPQGPWGSGGGRTRRCLSWPTSRPPRHHPAKPADRDPVCQGGTKTHQENPLVLQEPSLDLRQPRLLPLRHLQLPQPQQVCPIRSAPASSSTTPTRCLTTSLPS